MAQNRTIRIVPCCLIIYLSSFIFSQSAARAQTDTAQAADGHKQPVAGLDIGYGWRSNSEKGPTLTASYRTSLGSVDLAGILYQRWFTDETYSLGHFGFGFGFLIFKSYPLGSESRFTLDPYIGLDMTVWSSTLGVGIPVGAELHYLLVSHFDASVAASIEPQFNLNSDQNTRIFDIRLGIRYH